MLDELTAASELVWSGHGALPGDDGWVALHPTELAPLTLLDADQDEPPGELPAAVLDALAGGGAYFFRALSDAVGGPDDPELAAVLWDLVWAGRVSNDTLAPLRTLVGSGRPGRGSTRGAHRPGRAGRSGRAAPWARYGRGRPTMPLRTGPPLAAGRWSLLPEVEQDPTRRAASLAEVLLDRHGVVTRGSVAAERVPGGFAAVYRVLATFEETGRARRGYFVEGLGAAQFALPGAVDRLRAVAAALERSHEDLGPAPLGREPACPRALVLAATDPANPFGAAVPWPEQKSGHRPGRKAGALVVLVDGRLVLYVERGGRTLLTWAEEPGLLQPAVDALALSIREGHLGRLTVERADGQGVLDSALGRALEEAGFHATPRGLRLRA